LLQLLTEFNFMMWHRHGTAKGLSNKIAILTALALQDLQNPNRSGQSSKAIARPRVCASFQQLDNESHAIWLSVDTAARR
jgi:hypothetical protein